MSYVVQNFSNYNQLIIKTPRLTFFFILNNLEKLFIFIKTNLFFCYTNKTNYYNLTYFFLFFKYFYAKQFFKILNKTNLTLTNYYTNNLTKSSVFWIFKNIVKFINKNYIDTAQFLLKDNFFFNYYLIPVHTSDIIIGKNSFKNFFFFLICNFTFIWYQYDKNFKFYLNFLLPITSLKILKFYGGYFFKIYNF